MQILSALLNNCRESDRQIGKKAGVSGGAVRARIKKMEDGGIIEKYALKIEPPVLGLGVLYVVVSGQDTEEIMKQVSLIGEPFFVVPCIGGITVCSIVVKDELEEKIQLAKDLMRNVRVLSIFKAESPGYKHNLTKTDLDVIEELIKNPRLKIEDLSKLTNLSTKTITRSIEKLQKNDGIQFTLIYEPTKIHDFIPHAILTWIEGDPRKTLKKLEDKFSNFYLQIPFIAKNQIVLFLYSKNIYEMDSLTQKVRQIPSIKSADLFIPKKIFFPIKWLENSIKHAKKMPKLHLAYQTD